MELEIKRRFSDAILKTARERYGIAKDDIEPLAGFESFIYACRKGDEAFILRISHDRRRSEALIAGEVDWINYLAEGGAGVAHAILSEQGRLVEAIPDGEGGHFLATAFVRAASGPPRGEQWNEALFERYGRLIGRMHVLSAGYTPTQPTWTRPAWNDPIMLFVEQWLPPEQTTIHTRYQALIARLAALPQNQATYGLIHQDAHAGNFFVDENGRITLFDFDDCVYSWYANDVAIVLFYAIINHPEPEAFGAQFMSHFLRGYRREHTLEAEWLAQMPDFLKLREMDLYAAIYRSFDVENLTDPWVAGFMRGRRERIESDVPVVELPFASL